MQRGKLYVGYYAAMKGFSALLIGIDIRNSELSKSPSISNLVMASKTVSRETKRMLGQCDGIRNSASTRTDSSRRSKMWKTACQQQTAETSNSFCGNDEQNSSVRGEKKEEKVDTGKKRTPRAKEVVDKELLQVYS